jgi:ribonuclease-3
MDEQLKTDLDKLQVLLGVQFVDLNVLLSAVTHRSYLNEHREATWPHNERLEFLGDAVLELVVTDYLFNKYQDKPEGELTAVRAALVNTVSLADKGFIAEHLFAKTDEIVQKRLWQDAKSRFQELAQEHASITPTYETVSQEGPDHDRVFTVGVFLRQEKVAEGTGRSKQEAEQAAAEAAIDVKKWEK